MDLDNFYQPISAITHSPLPSKMNESVTVTVGLQDAHYVNNKLIEKN